MRYAGDADKHSGFAAAAEGASANVALHSVHVEDTSTNVVNWATQARDKALEAVAATDVAAATTAMQEAQGLLDSALNGLDGSTAPIIDGGGALTAYQHGQLMAGYSPVFSTTPPGGLLVAAPVAVPIAAPATGDAAIPAAAKMGLIASLMLVSMGTLLLIRRRAEG